MWSLLAKFMGMILSAVKPLLVYFAAFNMGRRHEKLDRDREQAKRDYEALADSVDARNAVDDGAASVHNDPRNRDKD